MISCTGKIHCNRRGVDRTHLTREIFHGSRAWPAQDCVARFKIGPIAMSSMVAPAHSSSSSCSHPAPLTLTSSRLTTSSRPTTQITLPDQNTTASITRNEDYGPLAKTPPSNRLWAQRDRHFWWVRGIPSFFQGSNVDTIYDLGDNDAASTDAEIDDGHTEMRLLYHCFHRRAKQKPIWDRLISSMQKVCLKVHRQI